MSSTTLKAVRIVCVAFGLAVLALMLFYPFEGDQATSAVGGEMALRRGAIAYNDFIDTRPQLIFWIYGLASMLFGHHEWSIRAFDMIYQIASLFIFYFVLRKILKDETVAFVSVIVYTIVYVGTGYDSTALTETFFFLPGILLLYYTEDIAKDRKAFRSGLYAGLCSGILFWLKFTFIAASGAAIIYLIINRSVKRQDIFRFCLGHLLSLGALIGMYVLFLSVTGALPRFLEAMHWVRGYTIGTYGTPTKALPGSSLFKMYPNGFILEYGLTCLVLLAIGIVNVVRKQAQLASGYSHLCLQVLIGLLAVYYEGK
ncbi:MAG: glycosyltransferase family 39 protein, partial [Bacteroidota bacterium]|nr:glycosyltransferase family 39 protein [Bacteroidota bacterium]